MMAKKLSDGPGGTSQYPGKTVEEKTKLSPGSGLGPVTPKKGSGPAKGIVKKGRR